MINLAIADLMMGIYLLIIAVVDVHTVGQYFNYAIDWQHGIGCKIAGFITVFASELSIFTLTVITLERWFAITFAIQLNKRLKLGLAVKVMIGGWLYALLMASLPLVGISTYSKTSICLPMENKQGGDVAYLIALLTINGLAFVLICACYAKTRNHYILHSLITQLNACPHPIPVPHTQMYCSIISQQTRATVNDMTIAKRMALLVFTDFVCWAPIAFFGLTAIAGFPLIDVPKSKFLLVTFYPLNSCANPFLYAILTKQYRRDFFILVSRYGFCTKRAMKYKNASSHGQIRVQTIRSNNGNVITASILSQASCEGHHHHHHNHVHGGHHHHSKHHYNYVCSRGHRHHHCCPIASDDNSGRSVQSVIYPDCSSGRSNNSHSNDSTHEIVRITHKSNGLSNSDSSSKNKKNNKKDNKRRKHSLEFMSSEDDESTSSAQHRSTSSPYPHRRSDTKLNRLPSVEQKEILARVLQKDGNNGTRSHKNNRCCLSTCTLSKSSMCGSRLKMCSNCVQRDSSSGEKSVVDYDSQLLRWTTKTTGATTVSGGTIGSGKSCPLCCSAPAVNTCTPLCATDAPLAFSCENASYVVSSHSNSVNEDTEI
ncbi:unnamed protein product [Oppiella nova]|uniref:G-protein coupled receptors family 1 profile domain-containing protein n=1 Tax=Oppiella nova TaxID=334625 RepID=A0A7R9M8W0_9ACAR|nr:unnamed protein product [Oppiella nova]CAG2172899.1 unnamed protein product [Oppiella nova]